MLLLRRDETDKKIRKHIGFSREAEEWIPFWGGKTMVLFRAHTLSCAAGTWGPDVHFDHGKRKVSYIEDIKKTLKMRHGRCIRSSETVRGRPGELTAGRELFRGYKDSV